MQTKTLSFTGILLLSLGDWGWVQMTNFILAGVLNLLYAVGLWRVHPGRGGTWGPILMALYGLGLVVVGIFRTDPANGFPPGVPTPTHPTFHGAIHAAGAGVVFLLLGAALLVFVRLLLARKERGWALYCLASAMLILLIFFISFTNAAWMARLLRLAVLIGWMAASLVAIKLLSAADTRQERGVAHA